MKRRTIHYGVSGLEYVYLKDAPVRQTIYGEVLALDADVIGREIAKELVRQGVPIRGAEVQFLRKSIGLSLARFGAFLALSAPAILKWERARAKRLEPVNEVAVRALMAEQLGVCMEGSFTALKGNPATPARLLLKVA